MLAGIVTKDIMICKDLLDWLVWVFDVNINRRHDTAGKKSLVVKFGGQNFNGKNEKIGKNWSKILCEINLRESYSPNHAYCHL